VSHAINGVTSPQFLVPTLSGVALFGVHGLIERSRHEPIFPVSLYRRGCFTAAIVSGIAFNFAWAVVQLQKNNFWQLVQHYSSSQVARREEGISELRGLSLRRRSAPGCSPRAAARA
jgi:hypothetical protein